MKTPHTIDTSVLESVSGGWRHGRWHRHGFRGVVVNNYWGGAQPVVQAQPQASFQMQMSSGWY